MKKILSLIAFSSLFILGCERELDSENIAAGEIAFPSIVLNGASTVQVEAGGTYEDAGAQAFLGVEDITPQMETTNGVNLSTGGIYTVDYQVATTNVLGSESVVNSSRTVLVTNGDVSGVDLSGNYLRNNDPSNAVVPVTKIVDGVYGFVNIFGNATAVNGFTFYHLGGTEIGENIQNSQFGRISVVGTVTPVGFDMVYSFLDPPNDGLVLSRSFTKQ